MRVTCTGCSPGAIRLGTEFAHRSERRLARILDFYRLRWEYEPHTFPLRWAEDGRTVESFTPDFWLPEIRTYVELTQVRRSNSSRKGRKVRRFRQLHPDTPIRVLYRHDLEALTTKYAATHGQRRADGANARPARGGVMSAGAATISPRGQEGPALPSSVASAGTAREA